MPTQVEKVQALAAHLLDGFLGLRETYAMLEPMLFDHGVIDTYGKRSQARGFLGIKNTLFRSCAQDIAKLCLDASDKAPSMAKIIAALETPALLKELSDNYSIWHARSEEEVTDPDLLAMLSEMGKREEAERRIEFDAHVAKLRADWDSLSKAMLNKAVDLTNRHRDSMRRPNSG